MEGQGTVQHNQYSSKAAVCAWNTILWVVSSVQLIYRNRGFQQTALVYKYITTLTCFGDYLNHLQGESMYSKYIYKDSTERSFIAHGLTTNMTYHSARLEENVLFQDVWVHNILTAMLHDHYNDLNIIST